MNSINSVEAPESLTAIACRLVYQLAAELHTGIVLLKHEEPVHYREHSRCEIRRSILHVRRRIMGDHLGRITYVYVHCGSSTANTE